MTESKTLRVRADFNGLFSQMLCLSHEDSCMGVDGNVVMLRVGMILTAMEEDVDENGNRDDLLASGIVERSPDWLRCRGSRWVLRIDSNGVGNESDFRNRSQRQ